SSRAPAEYSVIGVSGLNNADSGKNYGMKWRIVKPFRPAEYNFTMIPLSSFSRLENWGLC
ncbi:MAG: hypothetical protein ACK559_36635, partial [bacterium]